jgi:formamidopyrimidine-DNA glycosylase
MFELPEIVSLAKQMATELTGARVSSCVRGNVEHKFAWYTGEPEYYRTNAVGLTVGAAWATGNRALCPLEPGFRLCLGDLGGRVLVHQSDATLPRKYHLLLGFEDGRYFSVAIQGWGGMWLQREDEPTEQAWEAGRVSPIGEEFTFARFAELVADDAEQGKRTVKAFLASRPRLSGIGNGYVQDICFRARLHPKRDLATLEDDDLDRWYVAIRETLETAIAQGGRDTERDLHGEPGGYVALMDRRALDRPCPRCGGVIEKLAYLGGSCYVCPACQA